MSANLRASRLTIVYGPSGVGKSSLLQAGVVHGLHESARTLLGDRPSPSASFAPGSTTRAEAEEAARSALQEAAADR